MLSLESQCVFKICFCFVLLYNNANHLTTGPEENSEFCFPRISNTEILGKQNSLFPLGPIIKC